MTELWNNENFENYEVAKTETKKSFREAKLIFINLPKIRERKGKRPKGKEDE